MPAGANPTFLSEHRHKEKFNYAHVPSKCITPQQLSPNEVMMRWEVTVNQSKDIFEQLNLTYISRYLKIIIISITELGYIPKFLA